MNTCIDILKREMCTGCGTCKNICPVGAVSMETDAEGFWYPVRSVYVYPLREIYTRMSCFMHGIFAGPFPTERADKGICGLVAGPGRPVSQHVRRYIQ